MPHISSLLQPRCGNNLRQNEDFTAFNIVSAVARHLTPEIIGKIDIAAGLYGSGAQTAVNAASPAILSALADLVDKPAAHASSPMLPQHNLPRS
jgi:hypothetical protein